MEIIPEVDFYYDDNESPIFYWANVRIPDSENFEIVSHEERVEGNEPNLYHVDINIRPFSGGSKTIQAVVGDLEAISIEKFVRFNLVDSSDTATGDETVSTETADQESRPTILGQLPD